MALDKAFLEAELANLRVQETQAYAALHTAHGAIQLCEHLLATLVEVPDAKSDN